MQLHFSTFGQQLAADSGIMELMDDLGKAMSGSSGMLMLGGGNPAAIPDIQAVWRQEWSRLQHNPALLDAILCNYDTPQGNPHFLHAMAELLRDQFGWDVGPQNIAVTNSSQTAYFILFNMLAGHFADGSQKQVLLPLMPEYIGYADQGIHPGLFTARRPIIEEIGAHAFKYHIDFEYLQLADHIGAVCVSRPTNPTGNVMSDQELQHLSAVTKAANIPLFIDSAYGVPFPGIVFTDATPIWDEHIILTLSLSKLGLPGTRTGIVVATESVIRALRAANAVISLANGNIGQALITPAIENGRILKLSRDIVRPFYERRLAAAMQWVDAFFPADLPWRIHKCEGALFLWLWCPNLPIDSRQLYERLKARGVLVVSGHYFFYGLKDDWPHQNECIRINYSQPPDTVQEGLRIIGEEIRAAYHSN
ncbi:MAG: valine--pyruvate transaminase [Kiritimatiellia bacterium]